MGWPEGNAGHDIRSSFHLKQELLDLLERWPMATDFDLPPNSNVVIIGAYKGITMELLARLYIDYKQIIGFEPQLWAVEEARKRFKEEQLSSIYILPYGLGNSTRAGKEGMGVVLPMVEHDTDACSFVNKNSSRQPGSGLIRDADIVFHDFFMEPPQIIDLMVVNIEGGEYELLPYLDGIGWFKRINRLAVQWHLGLAPLLDELRMDAEIHFLEEAGLKTQIDLSPSWTYHVR